METHLAAAFIHHISLCEQGKWGCLLCVSGNGIARGVQHTHRDLIEKYSRYAKKQPSPDTQKKIFAFILAGKSILPVEHANTEDRMFYTGFSVLFALGKCFRSD